MPFRFDADRRLACLAADAARIEELARTHERPWHRSVHRVSEGPAADRTTAGAASSGGPLCDEVGAAIEAAVVGDARQLAAVLTEDAVGWSPSFSFRSRGDAIANADRAAELQVVEFRLERVLAMERVAVAEWRATVRLSAPLLVDGDLLIEPSALPTEVRGVTIADLRGDRIEAVATYFDDARVIEQVILGG